MLTQILKISLFRIGPTIFLKCWSETITIFGHDTHTKYFIWNRFRLFVLSKIIINSLFSQKFTRTCLYASALRYKTSSHYSLRMVFVTRPLNENTYFRHTHCQRLSHQSADQIKRYAFLLQLLLFVRKGLKIERAYHSWRTCRDNGLLSLF